jgi:hypothetical protein
LNLIDAHAMDGCRKTTEGHFDDAFVFDGTGSVFVQYDIDRTAHHKNLFGEPRAVLVRLILQRLSQTQGRLVGCPSESV